MVENKSCPIMVSVRIQACEASLAKEEDFKLNDKIEERVEETKDNKEEEEKEDDYKIDKLYYRIVFFCVILGVNFYRERKQYQKVLSMVIIFINVSVNIYFIGYLSSLAYSRPFDPDQTASTLGIITWTLQATFSTLFLAYWQSTSEACNMLRQIYNSNKGIGIHHHRRHLVFVLRSFYFVVFAIVTYKLSLIVTTWNGKDEIFFDKDVPYVFGDRRLFIIVQLCHLYAFLCWCVALFIFTLLVHSTNYEFMYYNEQVRSINDEKHRQSDEAICEYLLKTIKIHNQLIECVNSLDRMFRRYAFLMIATIIPSMTFALFMVFRRTDSDSRFLDLLFAGPLVCFSVFSFFALTNAPSRLHETIYATKSALCANTHIWFPYRPNVYHSALAFVCHLDQTNLGVSIWGFAIVSKPLVLTTLSVMVTCLAMFMQFGDCGPLPANINSTSFH